ncbi:hypothetical protein AAMO2058_001044700, partial [Amorphochlora amoebiformis]
DDWTMSSDSGLSGETTRRVWTRYAGGHCLEVTVEEGGRRYGSTFCTKCDLKSHRDPKRISLMLQTAQTNRNPNLSLSQRVEDSEDEGRAVVMVMHYSSDFDEEKIIFRLPEKPSEIKGISNSPIDVQYQASVVQNRTSDVQNRTSDVQNRASVVQNRARDVQNRTSDVQNRTSDVQNRTSDVQNRTSDAQNKSNNDLNRVNNVRNRVNNVRESAKELECSNVRGEEAALDENEPTPLNQRIPNSNPNRNTPPNPIPNPIPNPTPLKHLKRPRTSISTQTPADPSREPRGISTKLRENPIKTRRDHQVHETSFRESPELSETFRESPEFSAGILKQSSQRKNDETDAEKKALVFPGQEEDKKVLERSGEEARSERKILDCSPEDEKKVLDGSPEDEKKVLECSPEDEKKVLECSGEEMGVQVKENQQGGIGYGWKALMRRSVRAGDVIMRVKPYIAIPLPENHSEICHQCLGFSPKLFRCEGCNYSRFCSSSCMVAHRRVHNEECATLARLQELNLIGKDPKVWDGSSGVQIGPGAMIMLTRMHSLVRIQESKRTNLKGSTTGQHGGTLVLKVKPKPGTTHKELLDLPPPEFFGADWEGLKIKFAKELTSFRQFVKLDLFHTLDPLVSAGLVLRGNVHIRSLVEQETGDPTGGQAIYIPLAYIRHSCDPSGHLTIAKAGEGYVVATRDLQPGDELTLSLVDWFLNAKCTCSRCIDAANGRSPDMLHKAFCCRGCGTSKPLASTVSEGVACGDCKAEYTRKDILEAETKVNKLIDDTKSLLQHDLSRAAALLSDKLPNLIASFDKKEKNDIGVVLHPCHDSAIGALSLRRLLAAYTSPAVAGEIFKHYTRGLEELRLPVCPKKADAYASLGRFLIENRKVDQDRNKNRTLALKVFEKALDMRIKLHGTNHSLTREAKKYLDEAKGVALRPSAGEAQRRRKGGRKKAKGRKNKR